MKAIIDAGLEKYMSKKMLVWLTTTGMFFASVVDVNIWLTVTVAYVGTQGFIDAVASWRK